MGLHWGAIALQSLLPADLWAKLQTVQVDPNVPALDEDPLNFLNAETGEVMGAAIMSKFYRLRRSKLRALLAQHVDIRFGKQLDGISYSDDGRSVTARFTDGTSETGRLLIGADGAHSSVRRSLVGEQASAPNRLPFIATFIQASFPRELALRLRSIHPLFLAGIHPGGYFSFFGMHDATEADLPESWTFFFYISRPSSVEEQEHTGNWTSAQRLQEAKKLAERFGDPWKSAYAALSDDQPVWHMGFTDWDPAEHPWDNHGGRVTLAGDAAHTMTYQRGQGLNHSLTDADKLAEIISSFVASDDIAAQQSAVATYEKEMIARAGEEVRVSTKNTRMLHVWEQMLQSPVMTGGMHKSKPKENGNADQNGNAEQNGNAKQNGNAEPK